MKKFVADNIELLIPVAIVGGALAFVPALFFYFDAVAWFLRWSKAFWTGQP